MWFLAFEFRYRLTGIDDEDRCRSRTEKLAAGAAMCASRQLVWKYLADCIVSEAAQRNAALAL
jgi:hypothetical protein